MQMHVNYVYAILQTKKIMQTPQPSKIKRVGMEKRIIYDKEFFSPPPSTKVPS